MFYSLSIHRIVAVVATAAVLFTGACTKRNDASPDPPASTVAWTFDGTAFATNQPALAGLVATYPIYIDARSSTPQAYLYLSLFVPARVGTFAITGPEGAGATYNILDKARYNPVYYAATAGTMTVSSYVASPVIGESVAVGTFSFTVRNTSTSTDTKTINNGNFTVHF